MQNEKKSTFKEKNLQFLIIKLNFFTRCRKYGLSLSISAANKNHDLRLIPQQKFCKNKLLVLKIFTDEYVT